MFAIISVSSLDDKPDIKNLTTKEKKNVSRTAESLTSPRKARKFRTEPTPSAVLAVLVFISGIRVSDDAIHHRLCVTQNQNLFAAGF